jgi:hypothetical protein
MRFVHTAQVLRVVAVGFTIAIGGCGDDPVARQAGPCAAPSGTYRFRYVEQSGTCGAWPEAIVTLPGSSGSGGSCWNSSTTSADNCRVTLNTSCTVAATGDVVATTGVVDWSQAGDSAQGTINVRITATNQACSSVYGMTATRL